MALSEEDKTWLSALLAGSIGALCSEMIERTDGLGSQSTALRSEMIKRIDALRSEMIERVERTETTLLTEFHKWPSPVELRQRSHAAAMRAFDAELEAVSDRMTKLERPDSPAA